MAFNFSPERAQVFNYVRFEKKPDIVPNLERVYPEGTQFIHRE